MRISSEHVGRLLEARLERIHRAAQVTRPAGGSREADRATFSSEADDLRAALAAARKADQAPDPRLDAIGNAVKSGRYRVPAEAVADAVLAEMRG